MSTIPVWIPTVAVIAAVVAIIVGQGHRRDRRRHRAMDDYRRSPRGDARISDFSPSVGSSPTSGRRNVPGAAPPAPGTPFRGRRR